MRIFLIIVGILGCLVFVAGLATSKSDIQIIIAMVGFFGGMAAFGLSSVLSALSKVRSDVAKL